MPSLRILFCQPGDHPTPQRRLLDEKGGGAFHLGFATATEARAAGLPVLRRKRRGDRTGFTCHDIAAAAGYRAAHARHAEGGKLKGDP